MELADVSFMAVQFVIHESRFYQRLAIVESPVYLKGGDILSQCCELAFLDRTDFSLGIKNIHVDTRYTENRWQRHFPYLPKWQPVTLTCFSPSFWMKYPSRRA